MVRNEADIIARTLQHLLEQEVDGILVADNGSTDGTRAIVEELASSAPIFLADDREPAFSQGPKMTRLSHWARRAGAAWVIPFDADELWFARSQTVGAFLRQSRASVVRASIFNVAPVNAGVRLGDDTGWVMGRQASWWKKVAFRPHPFMSVAMGNHEVDRPGLPVDGLGIAHLPYRSLAQTASKLRAGAASLSSIPGGSGLHWRDLGSLSDEDLGKVWTQLLAGEAGDRVQWLPEGDLEPVDVFSWSCWGSDVSLVPHDTVAVAAEPQSP
ncbi:MAG: glycosyltransferase family 2 protein [Terrabacter sp.]